MCVCPCLAATNIFIHGNEEQGQLANEVRFLWGQNQTLKDQLSLGSRGTTHLVPFNLKHIFSLNRTVDVER